MQSHYGVFYGYMKLKEIEIDNIRWLAEMCKNNLPANDPRWRKYEKLIPFDYE